MHVLTRFFYSLLGWSSQQIRREEGEVGGAPEDHEGGGGHDH